MKWIVPCQSYLLYKSFFIKISKDLCFETDKSYWLKGKNGSGKTSFIKKILVPLLQRNPDEQYIIYVEQQIQAQFDAIKSYCLLQKPAIEIHSLPDMVKVLFDITLVRLNYIKRPMIIILDEYYDVDVINSSLTKFNPDMYCLIIVSHGEQFPLDTGDYSIMEFKQKREFLTEVS